MLYFILLLLLIITWVLIFRQSGYDLVSPVSLFLLGMIIATLLAIIGTSSWNSNQLTIEVLFVVILGAISVVLGSFVAMRFYPTADSFERPKHLREQKHKYSLIKYLLVISIIVFSIGLRIVETYRIAEELGVDTSNFNLMAKAVRNATATIFTTNALKDGPNYSFILRQLGKFVSASAYVSSFLFAHELAKNGATKKALPPFIFFFSACAYVLLTGSRGDFFYYAIAFFTAFVATKIYFGADRKKISLYACSIGALLALVGSLAFYGLGFLVGRAPSSGIIEYISFYFGGGIPSLQLLLDQGASAVSIVGTRTFYNIFSLLYRLNIVSDLPIYSLAWVDCGGHSSNIFTFAARYYLDFGFVGVITLSFGVGTFTTLLYKKATQHLNPVLMSFVGYISAYIFDMAREEFFYSRLLSLNMVGTFFLMAAITLFLTTDLREDWEWLKDRLPRRSVTK